MRLTSRCPDSGRIGRAHRRPRRLGQYRHEMRPERNCCPSVAPTRREGASPLVRALVVASRPVRRILSEAPRDASGRPSLWADGYPLALAAYPGVPAGGSPSPCLALLPVGFAKPSGSPRTLVRSYRTVSPLPVRLSPPSAVCSLWHCPAGHPDWALPSTVPCGVRTFLAPAGAGARPPGRLATAPIFSRRPGRTGRDCSSALPSTLSA
jgi:hypothetical protein